MPLKNPIPTAASNQAQKEICLDKIKSLEDALNRLNILENPLEIQNICNNIIDIKKNLEKRS